MAKISDVNKLVKIEQEGDKQSVICTSALICSVFDISRETLSDWVKRGCPKVKNGWYDIGKVTEWKFGSATSSEPDDDNMSPEAAKAHYDALIKKIKSERDQLDLDKKRGELVPRDEFVITLSSRAAILKQGLNLMSDNIASKIVDYETRKHVKKLILDNVWELLDSYSRTGSYGPVSGDDECE